MSRLVAFAYSILAYVVFFCTFLYAVGFVAGAVVPKSIDSGPAADAGAAFAIDVLLLGLFAVQHSVMARPAFKRWWTRIVPEAAERSTYVLLASLVLILLFWQWRPLPGVAWSVENPVAAGALTALSLAGFGLVLVSTFLIDHFDLFGLRQGWFAFQGKEYTQPTFIERGAYKAIRHPIMLGFIVAFWATPRMTWGHLLFAGLTTAYVLVAIQLEERDLLASHGESYEDYRRRVPMLLPFRLRRRG